VVTGTPGRHNRVVRDLRLVGRWSDDSLYLGAMEAAVIVFRPDGAGFTYWSRAGGGFSVTRFGWRMHTAGHLDLRLGQRLSGRWELRGREVRHHVDGQSAVGTDLTVGYAIVAGQDVLGRPATLLEFDQPVIPGTVGARFALEDPNAGLDDPTATGV
jgi:hypothetical protein